MRFEALNIGKALVRCATDDMTEEFGNIFFCNSHNITFSGIVFEGCGPRESNVFFTNSTDISFEDCTFRYALIKCHMHVPHVLLCDLQGKFWLSSSD